MCMVLANMRLRAAPNVEARIENLNVIGRGAPFCEPDSRPSVLRRDTGRGGGRGVKRL